MVFLFYEISSITSPAVPSGIEGSGTLASGTLIKLNTQYVLYSK